MAALNRWMRARLLPPGLSTVTLPALLDMQGFPRCSSDTVRNRSWWLKRLALVAQRVYSTCGLVLSSGILLLLCTAPARAAGPASLQDEVLQKEAAGDLAGAQTLLEQQAGTPQGSEALA